jgi:predicted nucleic acid-binding protein
MCHSLTKKERQRIIPVARKLWDDLMLDSPGYFSILPLMDRALEISVRARQGVYDCLYVALAERDGCELLTADDRLVRRLRPTYPFITSLTSLP